MVAFCSGKKRYGKVVPCIVSAYFSETMTNGSKITSPNGCSIFNDPSVAAAGKPKNTIYTS